MNVDELTVNWTENGAQKVRELAKVVLASSTSWATLAFLFQESDGAGGWRAAKVSLRRYRKRGKTWIVDKHLNLSSSKQATALAAAVTAWFAPDGPGAAHAGDVDDDE